MQMYGCRGILDCFCATNGTNMTNAIKAARVALTITLCIGGLCLAALLLPSLHGPSVRPLSKTVTHMEENKERTDH